MSPQIAPILASIVGLQAPNCHIRQPEHVARLLGAIAADGAAHLQLVTDFDHTVTRPYRQFDAEADADQPQQLRRPIPYSFAVLGQAPSISDACRAASVQLAAHYQPIERDHRIAVEARAAAMCEWWQRKAELYRGERLPRAELRRAVREAFGEGALRVGTAELFGRLAELRVPVLVLSAGLADAVEAVLKETGLITEESKNVTVMGNWFVYSEREEVLDGFDLERVIHQFNKSERALEQIARRNVLVIGDSLGDARMADGVPAERGAVLKIGFLCEQQVDANLEVFKEHFDIVLVGDHTMDVPRAILERIAGVENGVHKLL